MTKLSLASGLALAIAGASFALMPKTSPAEDNAPQTKAKEVSPVLNFSMKSLDGKDVALSQYQGKVVLMVNTASKCGYTKQYAGLQELHKKYADKGLVILGFPANDFGSQEPGTDTQIGEFCRANYGVDFPMFSKIKVKGEGQAPLYAFLTGKDTNPNFAGPIKWNFEKFLIGRDGQVKARFVSKVEPMSEELVSALEGEL